MGFKKEVVFLYLLMVGHRKGLNGSKDVVGGRWGENAFSWDRGTQHHRIRVVFLFKTRVCAISDPSIL